MDVTKLKEFADNKINLAQMIISVFDRVENIVGKGENAGYQHLSFFTMFSEGFFLRFLCRISLAEVYVKADLESAEQDQTSTMSRLILFYTPCNNKSMITNGKIRIDCLPLSSFILEDVVTQLSGTHVTMTQIP